MSLYLFNGKERDAETGLYYYGARYYSLSREERFGNPKISLWLNVDPLVEKTGTAYLYCNQNPINLVDPTGMAPEEVDDIIKIFKNGRIKRTKTDDAFDIIVNEDETQSQIVEKKRNGSSKFGELLNRERQLENGGLVRGNYFDFGKDESAGLEFMEVASKFTDNECGIESANKAVIRTDKYGKNTYGRKTVAGIGIRENVQLVYPAIYYREDGRFDHEVTLFGHSHPGSPGQWVVTPSGFELSVWPTKENGYTFKMKTSIFDLDNVSDRQVASPVQGVSFIYSTNMNTTVIYNSNQIINAYEGFYSK